MTGFLHEKEFSRKSFLKGGGALVVGVTALGTAGNAMGATGNTPFSKRSPADYAPDLNQVDTWLAITADNKVIVTHGEPEFAGTPTGILMLAAEELDITDMNMMVYAHPESWLNMTGGGGGSGGISSRSTQLRAAAAYAKQQLLGMASTSLGVPVASLTSTNGVISGGGKSVKFSDLIGGKNFNYLMSTNGGVTSMTPGQVGTIAKPVANYKLVGKLVHRIDIPAKVMGTYTYIHNVRVPGMLHARSVRPRGAGADASQNHYPLSIDPTSISHIPGAQVVQINNFVSVVAPKEYDAIQAAAQLKVVWKSDPKFGSGTSGNYWSWLRKAADSNTDNPPRFTADTGNVPAAMAGAAKTVSATYKYQYNNFVPIGPHAAVADINGTTGGVVYLQGQQLTQAPSLSSLLGIPPQNIRVIWYEGSSSYGGGQQLQAVEQAASISQKIGKPVRLQWMRWDQHGWDSYGPSHMYDVKAGIDATGKIVAMDWVAYGQPAGNIDTHLELLGTATWPSLPGAGNGGPTPSDSAIYSQGATAPRTAAFQYERRVLAKSQPVYSGSLKTSALRAPNAPQSYFASEQIVDELAYAAKMDPIAFRRLNIDGSTVLGARWLSVMAAATIAAGWKPKVANSTPQTGDVVTGRGFGIGTFASSQVALVADIEVTKKTGKIVVKHVWTAQNNGVTVNLEGVTSQMSGALIQGLSRALYEQATWNKERVTSLDWVSYPILRFKDTPTVTLINVHPGKYTVTRPGDQSQDVQAGNTNAFANGWALSGSGEPPTTAISSAVANAFFDATGVRIRQAPMNPATVRQVLKDAGVA
jgi:CO/xanthine dehydrogenase Mo-binding subunit